MSVHVCGPASSLDRRRILHCATCDRRTRHVVNFGGYWGVTRSCVACGDSWCDGERSPRPFARGWRERETKRLRKKWDAARSGPPPTMCEQLGGCDPVWCDGDDRCEENDR